MAQLKDLLVNGDARIIGKLYANQTLPDGVYYLSNVTGTAAVTAESPYTAALWTATGESRITQLYSGLTVALKVPVAGNNSYGTLLNINGLGYHPVCIQKDTAVSDRYPVGSTILLTYNATQTKAAYYNSASATTYTGVWQFAEYDSTNIYQLRDNNAYCYVDSNAGTLYRYEICLTNKDGKLIPYNNVDNSPKVYTKVLNNQSFDPFNTIYWYSHTDTVNAGASVSGGRLYYHLQSDTRYSFNIKSDGTAGTTALTAYLPVYIKALYNKSTHTATLTQNISSSSYFERSSIVQELPSSNPNSGLTNGTCYIYIYLGRAYSKYQMELSIDHPVYTWDHLNNCICTLNSIIKEIPQQDSAPSNPQVNDLWIDTDDNSVSGDIKTSRSTSTVDAYSCSYINNLTDNIGNVSTLAYSTVRTWEA